MNWWNLISLPWAPVSELLPEDDPSLVKDVSVDEIQFGTAQPSNKLLGFLGVFYHVERLQTETVRVHQMRLFTDIYATRTEILR